MKKTVGLLSLLLLCSVSVFAQSDLIEGYVITLKDDTLRGNIKLNPKKELEIFEKVTLIISETEKKTFKPNKIKSYHIDKAHFVSRQLDDEMAFFKVLSSGKLILLEYQYYWEKPSKEVIVKSEYYVEKRGEIKAIKIKQGSKYKKQLAEIMADNEELIKSFDDKDFDPVDMVEIFNQYNAEAN